jgi:hypothetical protein
LGPCLGGALVRLSAISSVSESASDERWSGELWLWGRLDQVVLDPAFLRVDAGAFLPLVRPVYGYEDPTGERQALHQPFWVVGVVQAGAGLRWP